MTSKVFLRACSLRVPGPSSRALAQQRSYDIMVDEGGKPLKRNPKSVVPDSGEVKKVRQEAAAIRAAQLLCPPATLPRTEADRHRRPRRASQAAADQQLSATGCETASTRYPLNAGYRQQSDRSRAPMSASARTDHAYRRLALILSSAAEPGHSSFALERVERRVHRVEVGVQVLGVADRRRAGRSPPGPWRRASAGSSSRRAGRARRSRRRACAARASSRRAARPSAPCPARSRP